MTDTAAQQLSDKYCIRVRNLMKDKSNKFSEIDRNKELKNIMYQTNIENGKKYSAMIVPKHPMPTVLNKCMTYLVILAFVQFTHKNILFWPKIIKHFQKLVENCLCRCETLVADKYQLQTTGIPDRPFAKVSIDLIMELPRTNHR